MKSKTDLQYSVQSTALSDLYCSIEERIVYRLSKLYLPKRKKLFDIAFYASAADKLSAAFTSERLKRSADYFNRPEFRAAYLLYFYLQTYEKARWILELARECGFKFTKSLILGAGPGAEALAAAELGAEELVLVDRNKDILLDGVAIGRQIYPHKFWRIIPEKLEDARITGSFDIVIIANLLNEVRKEKRLNLLKAAFSVLSSSGCVVVVEPALRLTARDLMFLRDCALESGFSVVAPCPHQLPCPMLKQSNRDWCHMYLKWVRPALVEKMDRLIKRDHGFLKLSYIIFSPSAPRVKPHIGRVVSSALVSKGKTEVLVCCGDGSLKRFMKLRREDDSVLRKLKRGDVIDVRRLE